MGVKRKKKKHTSNDLGIYAYTIECHEPTTELVIKSNMPQRGDGVDVAAAYPGNPTSHEIPDGDAPIIAPNRKMCAPPVEGTGESLTPRVQNSLIVLEMKRGNKGGGSNWCLPPDNFGPRCLLNAAKMSLSTK